MNSVRLVVFLCLSGCLAFACAPSASSPAGETPSSVSSPPAAQAAGSSAQEPTQEKTQAPKRTMEERRLEAARLRSPFWHDGELVASLGLSEAQISAMETRRQEKVEQRRQGRIQATEKRAQLALALEKADWQTAREIQSELSVESATQLEVDIELKIEILDTLSAEQRKQLAKERPSALRRSWLLPGSRAQKHNPLLDL